MGWHYILTVKCKLLQDYIEFVEKEYLRILAYKDEEDLMYYYGPGCTESDISIDSETDSESESESESGQNEKPEVKIPKGLYYKWLKCDDKEEKRKWNRKDKYKELCKKTISDGKKEEKELYNSLPNNYKNLIDIWKGLYLRNSFYKYNLENDIFEFQMSIKVASHGLFYKRDLLRDYETLLKDIIVPITSEIIFCEIESDDCGEQIWNYTDSELRNRPFIFFDKIKQVEHIYDENNENILETRVIYKHPIRPIEHIDINRIFGKEKLR